MNTGVTPRICTTIAGVLGVPPGSVSETSSQQTLDGWDSLAHIHLIMAIEAEFGVSFTPDQAIEMTSVAAIATALTACGVPTSI